MRGDLIVILSIVREPVLKVGMAGVGRLSVFFLAVFKSEGALRGSSTSGLRCRALDLVKSN